MSEASFAALDDLSQEDLVTLAFSYFKTFPAVPVNPDRDETFGQWLDRQREGGGLAGGI
jgi:hypothetical protein